MEAKFFTQLIFTVVLFIIAHQSEAENKIKSWNEHNVKVNKFKCKSPQPTSIYFKDFKEFENETYLRFAWEILPSSTVLHKCGIAGCCKQGKMCTPRASEDVKLVFRINKGGITDYKVITAKNHTLCGCSHISSLPK